MISAQRLCRRFGSREVVHDVSLDVHRSEIVALLGPNGAGKTTTMRMLAGLIAPSSGTVMIDGIVLTPATGTALRSRIGFLTEAPGLWDRLTVRENLNVYARLYGIASPGTAIGRMLELFDLTEHASARAAELSKGMRQKVALARALLHAPPVLLLDEPTSGLDPEIQRSVRRLFEDQRAAGCAILVSTHNLDEAERIADRVAVLQTRLLALDRPDALRKRVTTGRVRIRLAGDPEPFVAAARAIAPSTTMDDGLLTAMARDIEQDTPRLVTALAAAGAQILEVRPDVPALEDVYLHLVDGDQNEREHKEHAAPKERESTKEREASAERRP
jgi:ABC-2 type transport system ATP-binding protein